MKKNNVKDIIDNFNKRHNYKYDYSLVEYKNNYTNIKIICPIHGLIEQQPRNHIKGGCLKCINEEKTKSTEQFIIEAKKKYGDFFDYSLVKYITNKINVKIICPIHGEFEQTPINHLNKNGCKKCSTDNRKINTEKFKKRATIIHNNKFDYSLSKCETARDTVIIICPIHGEYKSTVSRHLNGCDCKKCSSEKSRLTLEEFITRANKKHNNKFDYSLVKYTNLLEKIQIICPIHGIFTTIAIHHLKGGCRKCKYINDRLRLVAKLEENKLNGYQLVPFFNPEACKIFDNIMLEQNIHIQHAMNDGEYYIKELGYWLDGYDKENNVAYEYDEEYHFKNNKIIQKDITRQQEIENLLKCKFIRIKK